jgi:hypothetical protein
MTSARLGKRIEKLRWIGGSGRRAADGSVVRVDDQTRCICKDGHDIIGPATAKSKSLDV